MVPRPSTRADVDVRRILLGACAIVGMVGVAALAAWALIAAFGGTVRDAVPVRPALPRPALETHPLEDFASYQRVEKRRLRSYGWIDRGKGEVHIPIELAMRLLTRERAAPPPLTNPPPAGEE